MDNTTPETTTQAVATVEPKTVVPIGNRGLVLTDLTSLWRFSTYVSKSGLAPKGVQTPEAVCVAIQMGLEVGLTPMAALQNIAVINGRPSLWGDAQLAVVRGTGELEEFDEWYEAGGQRLPRNPNEFGDGTAAVCHVKRRRYAAKEVGFSVLDAKRAGLWGKEGPWKQYPSRMLKMRARAFALRDEFGDALRGMRCTEEEVGAIDIEATVSAPAAETFVPPPAEPEPKAKRGPGRPRKTEAKAEPEPESTPSEKPEETAAAAPVVSPQPQEAGAVDALRDLLDAHEYTLPDLLNWNSQMGFFEEPVPAEWDAFKPEVAARLLKSRDGLLRQLKNLEQE